MLQLLYCILFDTLFWPLNIIFQISQEVGWGLIIDNNINVYVCYDIWHTIAKINCGSTFQNYLKYHWHINSQNKIIIILGCLEIFLTCNMYSKYRTNYAILHCTNLKFKRNQTSTQESWWILQDPYNHCK